MVLKTLNRIILPLIAVIVLVACKVTYSPNGASIDYNKTKTIQINEFPIRSAYVWGPMGPLFNNKLKDKFADHTRLQQVKRNGDLKLEGEIVNYSQRNKSAAREGYSKQTELVITVNVRCTNRADQKQSYEKQFTASQSFDTTSSLASVQEELVDQILTDIVDQIFNATVANW